MLFQLILTVVLSSLAVEAGKKLAADIPLCKRKDPNLNDCLKNAIQISLAKMSSGVPDLGLPVLDPLHVDFIVIDEKKNDGRPVDVDLSFKDVYITGSSKAKINSAVADWDNNIVSFEATFDQPIDIKGTYAVDGNILIMPIQGTGEFDIKLEGFKAHLKVHGKEAVRDGEKFMDVDRFSYTFDANHMTLNYENLFNGAKELGDAMNKFINENWRDILTEMTPAIEASFSKYFQKVAEKVFNQVPIDSIALP